MSRLRAPMALRIPISRVRSRTDTSMMFMIPIPPTTSEIEAIAREQDGEQAVHGRRGGQELRLVADGEVVGLARCAMSWRSWRSEVSSALTVSISSAEATLTPIDRTDDPVPVK